MMGSASCGLSAKAAKDQERNRKQTCLIGMGTNDPEPVAPHKPFGKHKYIIYIYILWKGLAPKQADYGSVVRSSSSFLTLHG